MVQNFVMVYGDFICQMGVYSYNMEMEVFYLIYVYLYIN